MDPAKYEFQSEFAKRYLNEGRAEGRASTLLKLLRLKFGDLLPETVERVQTASIDELDRWADHILSATSVDETLRN